MHVHGHYLQGSSSLKLTAWPIKDDYHVEPQWEGGKSVSKHCPGHMTKMAAMPIHDRDL